MQNWCFTPDKVQIDPVIDLPTKSVADTRICRNSSSYSQADYGFPEEEFCTAFLCLSPAVHQLVNKKQLTMIER
jgi:hypothetical protein